MAIGGNYGGTSVPTTPIPGNTLWSGRNTTYKDYSCKAYVGNANNLTFTYEGQTILATTSYVEVIIRPPSLGSDPTANVTFFCYTCNPCNTFVFSGNSNPDVYDIYRRSLDSTGNSGELSGITRMFIPTIIGGGGLNS